LLKAGAQVGRTSTATQILIDNLNAVSGPTERDGAFNEGILSGRTLSIVLYLTRARLTKVNVGQLGSVR